MRSSVIFLLLCNCFCQFCSAQEKIISGTVSDSLGNPLKWVNIGIKDKNIGIVSNSDGKYELKIPEHFNKDSLTFSYVGYKVVNIPIKDVVKQKEYNQILYELPIHLNTVSVYSKKWKQKTLGTKGYTPMIWAAITSYDRNDVYEQANLIKVNKPTRLLSANVRVGGDKNSTDSITFRLNLYKVKDEFPAERLIEQSFVKKFPLSETTFSFDLKAENIYIDEDCVVSFEFLPESESGKLPKASIRAKMGGNSGFARQRSLGKWEKMKGVTSSIFLNVEQ